MGEPTEPDGLDDRGIHASWTELGRDATPQEWPAPPVAEPEPPSGSGPPSGYAPPTAYGPPSAYGPPPGYGPPGYGPPGYPAAGWGSGPYGPAYGPVSREHPKGTTVLVLGICSIVICQILGPIALSMGRTALREIDAQPPGTYSNRGVVQAGWICGIIGTVLLAIWVAYVLLVIGLFAAVGIGSSGT